MFTLADIDPPYMVRIGKVMLGLIQLLIKIIVT